MAYDIDQEAVETRITAGSKLLRKARQSPSGDNLTSKERTFLGDKVPHFRDYAHAAEIYLNSLVNEQKKELAAIVDKGLLFSFPDEASAAPSIMLRGKLFRPIARGRRKALTREVVGDWGDVKISYTGMTLDQADLDVMLMLTRLLQEAAQNGNYQTIRMDDGAGGTREEYTRIWFQKNGFLRAIGRSKGTASLKWLEDSLTRLTGHMTAEYAKHPEVKFSGPIVGKWGYDQTRMFADINHDFAKMFLYDNYTLLDMVIRLQLPSGFAKWLDGFIRSHAKGSTISVEKLMDLSGSTNQRPRQFIQRTLEPSLEKLVQVGTLKEYSIRGHLVNWSRAESRQQRSLLENIE